MSKPITDLQAVELVQTMMKEIPIWKIHYTFKLMKLKNIRQPTKEKMRGCLALHSVGLPITTELLAAVLGLTKKTQRYGLIGSLHGLGDKYCLVLKRGDKQSIGPGEPYEWAVHSLFLKYFYGGEDE